MIRKQIEPRDYTDNISLYHFFTNEEIDQYRSSIQDIQDKDKEFKKLIKNKDWIKAELHIRSQYPNKKLHDNDAGYNFASYNLEYQAPMKCITNTIFKDTNNLNDILDAYRFLNKMDPYHTGVDESIILKKLDERFTEEEIIKNENIFKMLLFFIMDKEFETGDRYKLLEIAKQTNSKFTKILINIKETFKNKKLINKLGLLTKEDESNLDLPIKIYNQLIRTNNPTRMAKYLNKKSQILSQDELHFLVYNLIVKEDIEGFYTSDHYMRLLDNLQALGCKATRMIQEIIELYAHCGFTPDWYQSEDESEDESEDDTDSDEY